MLEQAPPPKRPRATGAIVPELLVIILDARLSALESNGGALLPEIWESLILFLRAYMLLVAGQKVLILAASSSVVPLCEISDVSDWEVAREETRKAVSKLKPEPGSLAAALSCGLCSVHRAQKLQKLAARLLVIDASASEVDYVEESSGLVSVAFAAKSQQVLIDALSVGSSPSSLLRQVCKLAEGKHVA